MRIIQRQPARPRPGAGERGFSLIEFLVATTGALILLGATYTMLASMFSSKTTMSGIVDTQQRTRVALNEMAGEILRAGTGLPSGGIAIPNGSGSNPLNWPGLSAALPTPNNVVGTVTPGDGIGPTVGGVATDAIALLTVDQLSDPLPVAAIDPSQEQIDFAVDIHMPPTEIFDGDLLLFSNVNANVFGVVTNVHNSLDRANFAASDPLDFNQPSAANGNMSSLQNPGNPVTYPPTTATKIKLITYYIDYSDSEHPKLMRKVNAQTPQVVADEIYNLQFTYDLYDFATTTATSDQDTTASPNQIRAVSIRVSGRTTDVDPRTDEYYYLELTSKVNVRNTTFRNRYAAGP